MRHCGLNHKNITIIKMRPTKALSIVIRPDMVRRFCNNLYFTQCCFQMFFKRQLIIKNYTKMFLGYSLYYIIIKYQWGMHSFSTERLIYLPLPSRYSLEEQEYYYHGSQKTRTCRQQIVQHLKIILLINRWYILKTLMEQVLGPGEHLL